MNTKYFFFKLIIVTICGVFFSACREPVANVILNKQELFLVVGETKILIATIQPINATNDKVTWTSSNNEVATVAADGLVEAIANGKTTITVTTKDGKITATCEVIVDYRCKWIGDWNFIVKKDWYQGGGYWGADTIYYLGKISFVNHSNRLHIEYTDNNSTNLNANENGDMFDFSPEFHYAGGAFEGNDKIYLFLRWIGTGSFYQYVIDGNKIERRQQ